MRLPPDNMKMIRGGDVWVFRGSGSRQVMMCQWPSCQLNTNVLIIWGFPPLPSVTLSLLHTVIYDLKLSL